jgi:hypothetical protein
MSYVVFAGELCRFIKTQRQMWCGLPFLCQNVLVSSRIDCFTVQNQSSDCSAYNESYVWHVFNCLAQGRYRLRAVVNPVMNLPVP